MAANVAYEVTIAEKTRKDAKKIAIKYYIGEYSTLRKSRSAIISAPNIMLRSAVGAPARSRSLEMMVC